MVESAPAMDWACNGALEVGGMCLQGDPSHMHRRNPELFGLDIEDSLVLGLGAGAASTLNKNVAHPFYDKFVPAGSALTSKVADAAGVLGVGLLGRELLKMVSPRVAQDAFKGAFVVFVAKLAQIPLPGYQFDPQLTYLNRFGGATATPALAAGAMSPAGALPVPLAVPSAALPGASTAQMLTIAGGRSKLSGL